MKDRLPDCFLEAPLHERGLSMSDIFLTFADPRPHILFDFGRYSEEDILQAERELGISFPRGYRELLICTGNQIRDFKLPGANRAHLLPLGELVAHHSSPSGRSQKHILDIGKTGYNRDHDVVPEMICLDLQKDTIFEEEEYGKDDVSTYEYAVSVLIRRYILTSFKLTGNACSVVPSIARNPVRSSVSPRLVNEIDAFLRKDCSLNRHPLSGGRFYYYHGLHDAVTMVLESSDYPEQQCVIQMEFRASYQTHHHQPDIFEKLSAHSAFAGLHFRRPTG